MYSTTEAIVLQMFPYKDKSAVVKLYSQQLGLISCWVGTVHGKKSKTKVAALQPFSIINAEISHKENNNLMQLREITLAAGTYNIHNRTDKSAIAIFLSELLMRSIKEASPDQPLYLFIKDAISFLEQTAESCGNFHLIFLIRLAEHLGILPAGRYSTITQYFDLEDGVYRKTAPMHPNYLEPDQSKLLSDLTDLQMDQFFVPSLRPEARKGLVNRLLDYYSFHTGMTPLKSHLVLEEVL